MTYKALIVDDEPLARRGVRVRLKKFSDFTILDDCEDAGAAIEAIRRDSPDLVFLDIRMPGLSGLEMIRHLPRHRRALIIFLTAYEDYALNAFEAGALDYLLKPIDRQRFAKAIRRARRQLKLRENALSQSPLRGVTQTKAAQHGKAHADKFLVRSGSRLTIIPTDEIDWIESAGDYAGLHVGEKTPLIRETLNNLERALDPGRFVRIHRSTIVQISRIRELRRMKNRELRLSLVDGTQLKVSRTYRGRLDGFISTS